MEKTLQSDSLSALFLLAAVKMDEDCQKGLIPQDFGSIDSLSAKFGNLISNQKSASMDQAESKDKYVEVNLPPFTKQALINIIQNLS